MPVYWSMLFFVIIIGVFCYITPLVKVEVNHQKTFRVKLYYVIILAGYIILFIGFRDKVLDSGAYIKSFNELPLNFEDFFVYLSTLKSGKGFYLLAGIFKIFISENHYIWLFFLAIISCFFLFKTLYKYSIDFPLTMYLFISTTTFTWLLNGTRQFLVVCILFGFIEWIIEKKRIKYILLVLILTTIHSSAIFMAFIIFFVNSEQLFNKKMLFFIFVTIIGTIYSESIFNFLGEISESMDYSDTIGENNGANILRFIITIISPVIVGLNYKNITRKAPNFIILAVNMSLIGSCFSFAATFTNGILVGRMPIYFTVYNLYLLPWLIKNSFTRDSSKIVWGLCVICYFVYFYYQMCIVWNGLMYVSEALGLEFL